MLFDITNSANIYELKLLQREMSSRKWGCALRVSLFDRCTQPKFCNSNPM